MTNSKNLILYGLSVITLTSLNAFANGNSCLKATNETCEVKASLGRNSPEYLSSLYDTIDQCFQSLDKEQRAVYQKMANECFQDLIGNAGRLPLWVRLRNKECKLRSIHSILNDASLTYKEICEQSKED